MSVDVLPVVILVGVGRSRGIVKQPSEESDRAWDVNERVDSVDPQQKSGVLQEESLDVDFMKNM